MARPRIKDVARLAGVSEKTVSNVLNDYVHVSEATRRAVRQAIDELGYRVNLAGRHLRRGRTGILALVVPQLAVPYFAELAELVVREAEQRAHTVLVHQTHGDRDRELAALDGFGADFADGVILSPLALTRQDLERHDPAALPVVLLGEAMERGVADHVAIDNEAAAREATAHLLALRRRRIAVVGGRDAPGPGTAEARTRGCRAALAAAGVPQEAALVRPVPGFVMAEGARATAELLRETRPPDALLCLNDELALGALRAVHEAGLRVPRDVAVAGFDDVERGRFSVPSLTTVSPDKAALARLAVELLLNRVEAARPAGTAGERAPAPPRERVVPHRLVVRESTGGPPAAR